MYKSSCRNIFHKKKPNTKLSTKPFVSHKPAARVLLQHKDTKQAHIALGFRTPLHYSHKDVNRLKIANIIFGGSMSSQVVFPRVRRKNTVLDIMCIQLLVCMKMLVIGTLGLGLILSVSIKQSNYWLKNGKHWQKELQQKNYMQPRNITKAS